MKQIKPFLLFVGDQAGKVEQAAKFYVSFFSDSKILEMRKYGENPHGENENHIEAARFCLGDLEIVAMDSGLNHQFTFTPANSLFVECDTEAEFDLLQINLSKNGQDLMPVCEYGFSKKFTWLNDQYGVSWQLSWAD